MYVAAFIIVASYAYGLLSALGVVDWAVQRQKFFGRAWNFAISREGSVLVSGGIAIFILMTILVERRRDASNFRVWQRRKTILESRRRHLRTAQGLANAGSATTVGQFRVQQERYNNLTIEEKMFLRPVAETGQSVGQLTEVQHGLLQRINEKTGFLDRNYVTRIWTIINPPTREILLRLYEQDSSIEHQHQLGEWREMVTDASDEFRHSGDSFWAILNRDSRFESLKNRLSTDLRKLLKHGTGFLASEVSSFDDIVAKLNHEIDRIAESWGLT